MLKCISFSNRGGVDLSAIPWQDAAFQFWNDNWCRLSNTHVDDFLRQDRVTLICDASQVVALHCYTFFDLRQKATSQHSYFGKYFSSCALAKLKTSGMQRLMTMEYLSVAPNYRIYLGASLAATLLSLGIKFFEQSSADAIVGVARADIGVASMAYKCGAIALDTNLLIHNTPCDLIAVRRGEQRAFRHVPTEELSARLWSDLTAW